MRITGLKPKLCRQALEAATQAIYVGKKNYLKSRHSQEDKRPGRRKNSAKRN
ncbi:hypothetical protein [Thermospira aquatica]|uniref:Uncharacterized protein n=1 Tax=Thermospira aquatica TaxID=2828656 RepID=A0AAX3BDN4_9SPIR|nr:hypothetical protein [Thermospira aquatica]URA10335.1 hypothetical protein KDW03_00590 [Thermospira aquatica]